MFCSRCRCCGAVCLLALFAVLSSHDSVELLLRFVFLLPLLLLCFPRFASLATPSVLVIVIVRLVIPHLPRRTALGRAVRAAAERLYECLRGAGWLVDCLSSVWLKYQQLAWRVLVILSTDSVAVLRTSYPGNVCVVCRWSREFSDFPLHFSELRKSRLFAWSNNCGDPSIDIHTTLCQRAQKLFSDNT